MKINLIEYIKKAGDTTSLSAMEQEKLETVLTEYMAMKPIRGANGPSSVHAVSPAAEARPTGVRGYSFSSLFFILKKRYMPIALILALLLSGSASYAAEGSMPGDLLYPIKVGINEKVGSALAISTESKAALEAKFAERRLAEAADLAADNKLTVEASAKISGNFAEHADSAVNETKELQKKDASAAIDFASNFESKLAAHESLLAQIDTKGDTDALVGIIHAKALAIGKFRTDAEGDAHVSARASDTAVRATASAATTVSAKTSIRKETALSMGENAKAAIKDTSAVLARVSGKLDASASANAKAQIDAASKTTVEGDALFAKGDFAGAFHSYQEAVIAMKRLAVYLGASGKININILPPSTATSSSEWKSEDSAHSSSSTDADEDDAPESIRIEGSGSLNVNVTPTTGGVSAGSSESGTVNVGL